MGFFSPQKKHSCLVLKRLMDAVRAGDLMTREVVFVERTTPLDSVAETMAQHNISGVPVVGEDGGLGGMVSERDFLKQLLPEGHILSALIGVAGYQSFPAQVWLAAPLAVATAIAAMHLTKTLHPPGGAAALIAVIGGDKIHHLGFFYALMPAGLGAVVMLVVALLVNNLPRGRKYPEFWL